MTTENNPLQWAAQWIEDSFKGETNERVIEFGNNMAMTIRAAALPDARVSGDVSGGEAMDRCQHLHQRHSLGMAVSLCLQCGGYVAEGYAGVLVPAASTVWSKDRPTVSGAYWYRLDANSKPDIVQVHGDDVYYTGEASACSLTNHEGGEWLGPIIPAAAAVAGPTEEVHRCPHFEPKGEDSGGAYNAAIIQDVTNELLYVIDKERLAAKPTAWYSLLIKQLIQRTANLRVMLAKTAGPTPSTPDTEDL